MSKPENLDTIIVKNKIYPNGLTEGQVWNYYQKYKSLILTETMGRELMFAIMVDVNKPIIKRKINNKYIKLTNSNYDKIISGRTIAIYSTMRMNEQFCIIDVDIDNFRKAKEATKDVYNKVKEFDFVENASIRYTGKQSFHIYCNLYRKHNVDRLREILKRYLINANLDEKYTIAHKRTKGKVNLDISIMKFRGAYITLNSLSIWGLKCMNVPYNKMDIFENWKANI